MKKLLFGAAIAMIVISPALAGGSFFRPSWRSDMSSDAPPVYGKEFGWPGSGIPVCHLGRDPSQIVCQPTEPATSVARLGRVEGERVKARVTHVPRLGHAHRLNESR
jgi:hypothetical protein